MQIFITLRHLVAEISRFKFDDYRVIHTGASDLKYFWAVYVISARTSRKWKHCLPYTRYILFTLFYNAQNKDLSIMNKRLHQTVAFMICIFLNVVLVCLVISLKFINNKFVHSLLNSTTTPCMVLLLLPQVPAGETTPPYQLLPGCAPCHAAREGLVRGRVDSPVPHHPRLFLSFRLGCISSRARSHASKAGLWNSLPRVIRCYDLHT